jgi:hypothetical protein
VGFTMMAAAMDDVMADSSGSQVRGSAPPRGSAGGVELPYARAFVVQFTSATDVRLEHAEGRVEHMQSGRRVRFASATDLLSCIARLLTDDKSDSAGGAGPTTSMRDTQSEERSP